jgi:hypothetical protein
VPHEPDDAGALQPWLTCAGNLMRQHCQSLGGHQGFAHSLRQARAALQPRCVPVQIGYKPHHLTTPNVDQHQLMSPQVNNRSAH